MLLRSQEPLLRKWSLVVRKKAAALINDEMREEE